MTAWMSTFIIERNVQILTDVNDLEICRQFAANWSLVDDVKRNLCKHDYRGLQELNCTSLIYITTIGGAIQRQLILIWTITPHN